MDERVDAGGATGGLIDAAREAGRRGPPPVHLWDPPDCGEIDIVIRRDGSWHHEGSPIAREGMVRLFASILRRDGDRHYLVTPVEKLAIRVEDAPFVAVDFEAGDGRITFTTNVGDTVVAGPDHPIRVETGVDGTPSPYVAVRRGLDALIDRKSFYRLVEIAEEVDGTLGIRSDGAFFPIGNGG